MDDDPDVVEARRRVFAAERDFAVKLADASEKLDRWQILTELKRRYPDEDWG